MEECLNWIIQSYDKLFEVFFLGTLDICSSLGFFGSEDFVSLPSSALFDLAFQLLEGFTLGVALGDDTNATESVDRLVLDQVLLVVIRKAETC